MSNNEESAGSISMMLLFITFMVLKLTNVIDWSWWWVTAPLWGPLAIVIVIAIIIGICMLVGGN